MSFKTTALVMDHGPVDPHEKLLLLSLADRSDEKGVCFPSRADLIARTGMANATLTRKLRMLEVAGWIQRKQRYNSSTLFRLNIQRLYRLEAEAQKATVPTVPKGFEPFEDEPARVQVVENKGDAHCEHTDAHTEHTDAHGAHLTYQITNQITQGPSAINLGDLSQYNLTCLREGKPVLVGGVYLQPTDTEHQTLQQMLREATV